MSAEKVNVIYIAGFGRNGGTLLDRILGEAEDYFSLGEFKFVWHKGVKNNELCNCGEPFNDCGFWQAVLRTAFGEQEIDIAHMLNLSTTTHTRYIPFLIFPWKPSSFKNKLHTYTQVLRKLYLAVATVSRKTYLIDSSKFAGYALALNMIPEIEISVLHLIRDSRAAAFSWEKKKRKTEITDNIVYMRKYNFVSSSIQWIYRNITAELLKKRSKNYIRVRYEDFTHNPQGTYDEILKELSHKSANSPFTDNFTVNLGESHTQSGNPGRFAIGRIVIREDDAWKNSLHLIKKILVTLITLPLLIRYGYINFPSRAS